MKILPKKLPKETHIQFADDIRRANDMLLTWMSVLGTTYGLSSKAFDIISKTRYQLERLKCEMDDRVLAENPRDEGTEILSIYYGGKYHKIPEPGPNAGN